MPSNPKLLSDEQAELEHPALSPSAAQRQVVEMAMREVCDYRDYVLHAVNVRTNHVHSVVSAPCSPAHVMDSFKSHATRKLREAGLLDRNIAVGAARKHAVPLD